MTKCPACDYEYKGKRKIVRRPGAPEICGRCGDVYPKASELRGSAS